MRTYFRSAWRVALVAAGLSLSVGTVFAAPPVVGPNVNMVSGTKWPEGDPFLTKQNEPSIAVSSRNSRHLLAGSNDYRLVPVEIAEELAAPEAWIQVYKSVDGGASWRATPLGGCPINIAECNDSTGLTAALRAKNPNFGADPTARPGPYGTFFLTFIAGKRDNSANGVVAVQRFVDKNNDVQRVTDARTCEPNSTGCVPVYDPAMHGQLHAGPYVRYRPAEDPILPDVLSIIDVGTPGQAKDKPWVVADVGRRSWNGSKTCELLSWTKNKPALVTNAAETVGAFNVYVSYANFTGNGSNPSIFVATSSDCGKTFGKPVKISQAYKANQGTSSAVDPLTGRRLCRLAQFRRPAADPDEQVDERRPFVGLAGSRRRPSIPTTRAPPACPSARSTSRAWPCRSTRDGKSRVHVAWSQRKVAPSSTPPYYACPAANPADCDARIVVATSTDGGKPGRRAVGGRSSPQPPLGSGQSGQPEPPRPPGAGVADVRRGQAARDVARPAAGPHRRRAAVPIRPDLQ